MTLTLPDNGNVQFLRIDDRLIHGQVIVGWLPHLDSKKILVVNDRIAQDLMRQEMMGLSVPPHIDLAFSGLSRVGDHQNAEFSTLVLVSSPADAWRCLENGLFPEQFNVGGLHAKPGKEEIFAALHIDQEDRNFFQKILAAGVEAVFQPTPQNDPIPMGDIL